MVISMASAELVFDLFIKQECSKVLLVYPDDVNKFVSKYRLQMFS